MQGSTATLKIISPGDRTYEDLYTIEVGYIRLDVYRNGALYWSGALDPEFYEEPYEMARGYEVSLTFSDFGILDRLKYDLDGMQTLDDIVLYALEKSTILHNGVNTDYVSTFFNDGTPITGGGISVRSENFMDEDGELSTLYEALEGILQPLAIRMVQRAGLIYLYDLNGLYNGGGVKEIEWDGDSQTMGTDRVANNVIVSFSPYSSAELLDGDIEYGGSYDVTHYNLTDDAPNAGDEYGEYYSFYPDYGEHGSDGGSGWDYDLVDFTIFLHSSGTGLLSKSSGCPYFHILPLTGSADECSGVAYAFRTGHGSLSSSIYNAWKIHSSIPHAGLSGNDEVLTSLRVFLPALGSSDRANFLVRIVQEILVDARYNPFSGSTSDNEESNDNNVKVNSGFVFIPAKVTLYDEAGNALYHYSNKAIASTSVQYGRLARTWGDDKGRWVEGADPGGDFWLEYYDPDDPEESAGIRGWQGNRHCIGRPDNAGGRYSWNLNDSFKQMDDGEYLPYPPVGGYLEVQVQVGILGYNYGDTSEFGSTDSVWDRTGIYDLIRWCLYKAPTMDVVNYNLIFDSSELEDVEYSGYINKSAKEEISIETICGTAASVCPTARGCYHRTSTGEQLQELTRAGITDHPEKLLIGTIYSQYAGRKTTLTGEAVIDGGLSCYSERNQDGKLFMLMSDIQDLITGCTEAEYCEFRPDEYEAIEEVT